MIRRLLTLIVIAALATPVLADDPKPGKQKGAGWEKEWEKLLKKFDKNGDGQISKEEIAAAKADEKKADKKADKKKDDDKKDDDKKGDDKKPKSKHAPGAALEKHFDEIDTNKDGKISKEEFKAFLDKMKEKAADKKGKGDKGDEKKPAEPKKDEPPPPAK